MSQISEPLSGVPRTLLLTTRARVEEHQRDDAIFRDPKAYEWWRSLAWDPTLDELYTSISQLSWAVRANFIDRVVQRHIAAREAAVVIELGAGLSTRYDRIGQACRCWLDLDLPEVTALRRQLDIETEQHRFLEGSALDLSWTDEIPACSPADLAIVAEGLLMYFEASHVRTFLRQLRQRFPGATLVFDVVGGLSRGKTAKQLAQLGAPLQWFVKNERDLTAMGLTLVEVRSLLQENCRYPHRIGVYRWISWLTQLPPLRNASLMCATTLQPL